MNDFTHHPIGPTAFDAIMARLKESNRRQVRLETKLCKLMEHMGLAAPVIGAPVEREQLGETT